MTAIEDIPSQQSESELLGLQPRTTFDSSREIKSWPERIKEQALFSARTTSKAYLDGLRKTLAAISSRSVIPTVAESSLRGELQNLGYDPRSGFPNNDGSVPPATPGSITDLSSSRRIHLIIDTNIKQARSMGQLASSENPIFLMTNPAWRLTRTGARKKPRGNWNERWEAAGNSVGWNGASKKQFVALKNSPIWEALGKGAGGYADTLSSAFPPFAFGSGMAWVNVGRREWKRICEQEGMQDGLENLKNLALAGKRANSPVDSIPDDKGITYPSSGEKRSTTHFRRVLGGDIKYIPKVAAQTRVIEELNRAISDSYLAESLIKNNIKRIVKLRDARYGDLAESFELGHKIDAEVKALEKAKTDIAGLRDKMNPYLDSARSMELPQTEQAQVVFDRKLNNLYNAVVKARGLIRSADEEARRKCSQLIKALSGDIVEDDG